MLSLVCACPQAYKYLREEVQMFKGKPIMVRIKAETMPVPSYAPKNAYGPVQLDSCSNPYSPYFAPAPYQQPYPAHLPGQHLYEYTDEVQAASGYSECAEVSLHVEIVFLDLWILSV